MTIDTAFTLFPSLATNRLQLRQIQPSDAEAFFAPFSDEETMQFYGEPHRSLDDTRQAIEQTQARFVQREAIRWGITPSSYCRVISESFLRGKNIPGRQEKNFLSSRKRCNGLASKFRSGFCQT